MILLILANSGGLLNIKDKFGKTPIDYINSKEMKKTIEMIKPKNNKKSGLKKIYFTPSKKSNLVMSSVISKTIRSESPATKGINKSNTITLKDSGKAKFNFIELKTGSSKKKINNNTIKNNENNNNINLQNKENEDTNIKINLFNIQNQEIEPENKKSIYAYKKAKYYYKDPKFDNINNKLMHNSSKNNYNYIESPIQEESSSYISSNKYFKNQSTFKNKNIVNATLSPTGDKKSTLKKIKNNTKSQTASQKKYIRKKSNDKISSFKCESNQKIKTSESQKIYYENKIMAKSKSNKNMIKNSRNIEKIFLGDISNTNNTNSLIETLTNYKTQLTTNSNKGNLTDRNSLYGKTSEINYNYHLINTITNEKDKRPYNRPKIIIKNSSNFVKNIREIKEKKILFKNPFKERITRNKNRNKNLFNSRTTRHYPTYYTNKTLTSISNEQKNATKLINNYTINNKENISFNVKQSLFSDMTDVSTIANINTTKNNFRNSQNSNQSKFTYYTLTRNGNNSLLEIIEKTNNSNLIIHDRESLPIYNWLKEIDLLIYLSLFLKKKIYSLQRTISDLRQKKVIITPNDIRNIGISIPGHVYRIFTKLELDAGLIDKKIYDYLLMLKLEEEEKIKIRLNKEKNGEESSQSIYECGGCNCCSLKRSHVKITMDKRNNNVEINPILNLDKWLLNINMYKYKQNFIKKGFDKIEFFILQMFSSIPLEEKIFEKEMNIDNNNDIDLIILQLNKDVKLISNKFKKKRSSSVEMDKNKVTKYIMANDTQESEKRMERASSYSNCSIF